MDILFSTSLIASFVAGVVALFAPCCITFLLPTYLGNVFKEKEKVLLMTLVFGAGIFVVLLPAVLGVALISKFLFDYHNIVYLFSSVMLIFISLITFLGIKLPMPNLPGSTPQKTDVFSIFSLGIFSGITSACCAPVLIGILTLTFLSPSFFGALIIGAMYVLGMITPLLLISLFMDGKMPGIKILRKSLFNIKIAGKDYQILTSNLIASVVFFLTGILTYILTIQGKLAMGNLDRYTKMIQNSARVVELYTGNNQLLNIGFIILVVALFYWVIKKANKNSKNNQCHQDSKEQD